VKEDDGGAVALVEVGEAEAVDLAVARLEGEVGKSLEPLLGRALDIDGHGGRLYSSPSSA
jgi:hypothetical protein